MRTIILISAFLFFTMTACGQDGQTFTAPVKAYAGVQYKPGGPIQNDPFLGSGGGMTYPGPGIPTSNGDAWGASIVNNSVNWDADYNWITTNGATILSWGPHSGLYRPITWKPNFYTEILGLPLTFPPAAHTHDYNSDITGKPNQVKLMEALKQLGCTPIGRGTTDQINALVIPADVTVIVEDITLGVTKKWNGTKWVVLITSE
jgi:predicted small lipoprotein YifL